MVGLWLSGEALPEVDEQGQPVRDDTFLILFNATEGMVSFVLPNGNGIAWQRVFDTTTAEWPDSGPVMLAGETYALRERSLALFRQCEPPQRH